jgi:hypothetical protein
VSGAFGARLTIFTFFSRAVDAIFTPGLLDWRTMERLSERAASVERSPLAG